jgi:N-methylhydantoinase B
MNPSFDPVLLSVLANAFDGIVREMTNGLLRSARSSVINTARDFSCSILTADNQLLASAEGCPVHVFGSEPLGEAMQELQGANLAPGDAFLHNDPYRGNSHAADHAILVPIFVDGVHVFTGVAKAHQADCGNAIPTTFSPTARDVYEEGALIFPCVRIQRDYEDVEDIVRMCRARIRVPDQWYGDYLATVGAARIAERRVQELVAKHGIETVARFVEEWFAYSERLVSSTISGLPAGTITGHTVHDPFPGTDADGLPLSAVVTVEPEGRIVIDLRDNPDNQPNGLNLTKATATAAALAGALGAFPENVPTNAGTFRRFDVLLREGCVVGIPEFPHSCSSATTNLADRVVGLVQAAFAQIDDGFGLAEGSVGQAPGKSVISGLDQRNGRRFVNQIIVGGTGGPATPFVDGWPTYQRPVAGALLYHDSVEIDEQRYPILITDRSLIPDSGGAGRLRGGQACRIVLEPRGQSVTFTYAMEARLNPPHGVRGGADGAPAQAWIEDSVSGERSEAPPIASLELEAGKRIVSLAAGGGGYGDPLERDPAAVLDDLLEGRISASAAHDLYGIVVVGGALDGDATAEERERRKAA